MAGEAEDALPEHGAGLLLGNRVWRMAVFWQDGQTRDGWSVLSGRRDLLDCPKQAIW
jgi:hypothetical protein